MVYVMSDMSNIPKQIEIYPTIMLIRFIEQGLIKAEEENSKYVIVSSYMDRKEELSALIPEQKILLLSFDSSETDGKATSFTAEMAQGIYSFLQEDDETSRIYICCDDGQTRSAGIACALYRFYGIPDMENIIWRSPYACPNMLVFKLVAQAFGINIPGKELQRLVEIREEALANAIRVQTDINREIYRYGLNSRVCIEKRLAYFYFLSAYEEKRAIRWGIIEEGGPSLLSSGVLDAEGIELCREVAFNSLEFIWYYGIKAEDCVN